jgi:LysR family transcriptional activator of nhaA
MFNLNYLRYFYVCAQSGSFTKAAEKLNLSQPSLSMQIKTFEGQLGFSVFIRTGRSLQLTPQGQALFIYASKIFAITEDISQYLKTNQKKTTNLFKIGVSDEIERPFVADVVGRLIRSHSSKSLKPSLVSRGHEELIHQVLKESLDVLITHQKTSQLKELAQIEIPVMLVSSQIPEKMRSQRVSLQNAFRILDQGLILPTEEMLLAQEIHQFLKKQNIEVETILSSNVMACLIRATQEKLGAALLPIAYVSRELQNKTLQSYGPKDGFWQHKLYLYTYRGNTNPYLASLIKILRDISTLRYPSLDYENSVL